MWRQPAHFYLHTLSMYKVEGTCNGNCHCACISILHRVMLTVCYGLMASFIVRNLVFEKMDSAITINCFVNGKRYENLCNWSHSNISPALVSAGNHFYAFWFSFTHSWSGASFSDLCMGYYFKNVVFSASIVKLATMKSRITQHNLITINEMHKIFVDYAFYWL